MADFVTDFVAEFAVDFLADFAANFVGWRLLRAFLKGGDLNPGERHSRDTRDDGTVTLCTLRAATVLSKDCRADFGRPLTRKVMSHSCDGPGVTAPLVHCRQTLYLSPGCGIPPLPLPPFKKSPNFAADFLVDFPADCALNPGGFLLKSFRTL